MFAEHNFLKTFLLSGTAGLAILLRITGGGSSRSS